MSDSSSSSDTPQDPTPAATTRIGSAPSLTGWIIGVVVAAVCTWATLNYGPRPFELPEELQSGTVANNPELAAQAAEEGQANQLKNGLILAGLTGLYFGFLPALFALGAGQIPRVLVLALVGLVCGCVALFLTRFLYGLITPADIAMEREEPGMWREIVAYALLSSMTALPASLAFVGQPDAALRSKSPSGLLGGLVAGLLLPIASSFLAPDEKTNVFPTDSATLSVLWTALLAVLVIVFAVLSGERGKPAADSSDD